MRSAVVEYELQHPENRNKLRDMRLPDERPVKPEAHTLAVNIAKPSPLVNIPERAFEALRHCVSAT